MSELRRFFEERENEVDALVSLIESVEVAIRDGRPTIGHDGRVLTTVQYRILCSTVYVLLYNLVEATVTRCIDGVRTTVSSGQWFPRQLSTSLRREWVRHIARTHTERSDENRLSDAMRLCDHLIRELPVGELAISTGGGGNWDDEKIFDLAKRIGFELRISDGANEAAKRPFRDEKGALAAVVMFRNGLAHGSMSFEECGSEVTGADLRDLSHRTVRYLSEVLDCFEAYIEGRAFLAATEDQGRTA